MEGFEATPEILDFLAQSPKHDERGLPPHEVREILEEAFEEARLKKLQQDAEARGLIRPHALRSEHGPAKRELELHERVLRRADAMQRIIESGRLGFEDWCVDQGIHPGEMVTLFDEAMAYIRELTSASAEDHLATARARYDDLYRRLVRRGELKEAASVQAKLDKLNQLGSTEDGDTLGSLARTVEKLSGPLKKPERPT